MFTEKAVKNTWLETHNWGRNPETGHCIVPTHGDIPNMAIPVYAEFIDNHLDSCTGLMDIDPGKGTVTEIHFVLERWKEDTVSEYVRKADTGLKMPINDEDGARLYARLLECAESYTDDPVNFFEAFVAECRGGAA